MLAGHMGAGAAGKLQCLVSSAGVQRPSSVCWFALDFSNGKKNK